MALPGQYQKQGVDDMPHKKALIWIPVAVVTGSIITLMVELKRVVPVACLNDVRVAVACLMFHVSIIPSWLEKANCKWYFFWPSVVLCTATGVLPACLYYVDFSRTRHNASEAPQGAS